MKRGYYNRNQTPLRVWLERNQKSQEEFRREIDISQTHMTMVVNGNRRPSKALVQKIIEKTGLKESDFETKQEVSDDRGSNPEN